MKQLVTILLLIAVTFQVEAQNMQNLAFGKNTLIGKAILKDLKHPKTGKTIKNALVFKLPQKVQFKVEITANFTFAPSHYYPLLVNIIDNFEYKIIKK